MANKKDLREFAMTKVIQVTAYDLDTNEVLADTKNLKNFTLNDSTPLDFLTGGESLQKLLPVLGQQDCSVEFANATTSFDWLALQIDSKVVTETKAFDTNDENVVEDDGTITIEGLKGVSSIFEVNMEADGRDGDKIEVVTLKPEHYVAGTTLTIVADGTLVDASTEVELATVLPTLPEAQIGETVDLVPAEVLAEGQCTVDLENGVIAFHESMVGESVHIFYTKEMEETKTVKSAGTMGKTVRLVVKAIMADVHTQKQFLANIICYKAKCEQNNTLSSKNDGVPDDVSFKFGCLYSKANKCSYEIVAIERDKTNE